MKYILRTLDLLALILITLMFTLFVTMFYGVSFFWEFKKKKGYREEIVSIYSGLLYNIKKYRGFFETVYLNMS